MLIEGHMVGTAIDITKPVKTKPYMSTHHFRISGNAHTHKYLSWVTSRSHAGLLFNVNALYLKVLLMILVDGALSCGYELCNDN